MRDFERTALFSRARSAATPTQHDRRRVRAGLDRKLAALAGASVAIAVDKASAMALQTVAGSSAGGLAAGAPVSIGAAVKGLAVISMVVAAGWLALPPRVVSEPRAVTATVTAPPALSAMSVSATLAPAIVSPSIVAAEARDGVAMRASNHEVAMRASNHEVAMRASIPSVEPSRSPNPSPREAASRSSASVAGASVPSSGDSALEIDGLKEIQIALRDGDAAHVLSLVAAHARRFPSSSFAPEREGARVLATCLAGDATEARRTGLEFLGRYPLSPLAARVRMTCGVVEPAP